MAGALASTLSVLALLLALTALVLATIANRRWARRPRSEPASQSAGSGPAVDEGWDARRADAHAEEAPARAGIADLRAALGDLSAHVDDLRGHLAALDSRVDEAVGAAAAASTDPTALRHVAVVRYDAFADVGGRLSYSLAVLDDTHSGIVLTTLAGKSDVRTYVRAISGGRSDGTLTAEEQQAIDAAGRRE